MSETPSLKPLMTQQDQIDRLTDRVMALERAILLLANHVGATGWWTELQTALDEVRDNTR